MSSPQAILLGAVIIALSIIGIGTIPKAQAQRTGPFQLMHHSNVQANAGVFRIDESTGEVSYCFIAADNHLACTGEK